MEVELHTEEYAIVGSVITPHQRVKDLLENFFHTFLPVKAATITHHHRRSPSQRQEVGDVMVRLGEVILAIP